MPDVAPSERPPSQHFACALGRLRALVLESRLHTDAVVAQAGVCGRRAHAAGHSRALMVDLLAGIVGEAASRSPALAVEIVEAASAAYLAAAEPAARRG